jgi:hypothetical protein
MKVKPGDEDFPMRGPGEVLWPQRRVSRASKSDDLVGGKEQAAKNAPFLNVALRWK